jgi:hypothetical protein
MSPRPTERLRIPVFRRPTGQNAAAIERAWRAQQRLHRRWQRMAGRGKPHPKIVVACARELAGFVWAIGSAVLRSRESPGSGDASSPAWRQNSQWPASRHEISAAD